MDRICLRLVGAFSDVKRHLAVFVTQPNFVGTSIEIQPSLVCHLGFGIAGRDDFDTDLWGVFKSDLPLDT